MRHLSLLEERELEVANSSDGIDRKTEDESVEIPVRIARYQSVH